MENNTNFNISNLGKATINSPIHLSKTIGDNIFNFVENSQRILAEVELESLSHVLENGTTPYSYELAGPRETIFFEGKNTTAAIVTCGGLCPGINNVIRSLVMALHYFY